ncbi:MAG: GAF domain-containing protein [Chloroflexi bacterium]|nr:GAF domain-containing protein [Chloroflexota bacterium]
MAYLLLLPAGLYIALGIVVLRRPLHGLSRWVLAAPFATAALLTLGLLLLTLTSNASPAWIVTAATGYLVPVGLLAWLIHRRLSAPPEEPSEAAPTPSTLDLCRQRLLLLNSISAEITSSLELDQVVVRGLEQTVRMMGADSGGVYLLDSPANDRLRRVGDWGIPGLEMNAPEFLELDGTVEGTIVRERTSVLIPDTRQFPAPERGPHLELQGLRAGIGVPLITPARVLGVLLVGFTTPQAFEGIEVTLLESIGRQLGVAIDNARLYDAERRQRQISEALRAVANVLSTKKLDDALQAVLEELHNVMSYTRATVQLLAEPGQLAIRARLGFQDSFPEHGFENLRIEIGRFPHLLEVFTRRQPVLVINVYEDKQWQPPYEDQGSWIGVPLIIHDRVLGCLSITHREPNAFTHEDVQLASVFADQAVIAIQNAQLFDAEQQRRVQAEQLQHASYDLATSPDLDSALSKALSNLARILPFEQANIGLINPARTAWTTYVRYPVALPSDSPTATRSKPFTDYPLIRQLIEEKRPLIVLDTRHDYRWRAVAADAPPIGSWIGAPLIVRDHVVGILNVNGREPFRFTPDDFQVVQLFANQIAAAIENFRLLDEASRQNRALGALNTILAASNEALTQDNLLSVSLAHVLEALSLDAGTIHQLDTNDRILRLRAAAGVPDQTLDQLQRLPAQASLPTLTLPDGRTLDFFSVPLVSHGTRIGLLSVCPNGSAALNAELQTLLTSIGQQLGVLMDNAALFEVAMRREALSTDMGRLGLAISAELDRETVLTLICYESMAVFETHGAYIWLLEGDRLVGAAAAGLGADDFIGSTYSLADDKTLLPVRVLHHWRPQYINRLAEHPGVLDAELMTRTGAQAAIAVPLLKADVPIGTLLLIDAHDPDAFSSWLTDQIGLLGVQAALAIQNATLFDEARRRLEQLRLVNEVSRYATAILALQGLIEGVARKLFETLNYDYIGLLLVEDRQLVVHSVFGRQRPLDPDRAAAYYQSMDRLAEQVVRHAETVLQNRPCHIAEDTTIDCCSLAIPLLIADEAIGCLVVDRAGHDNITQHDLDVLEPLAAQLAISISNARLFERVRHQTLELEARVSERTLEIRRQQERTEAILRSLADAVIVFDLNEQVVMTNPVAKQLFDHYDLAMDLGARIHALVASSLQADSGTRDCTEVIELGPVSLQAKAARVVSESAVLGSVVVLRDISRLQELDRMKDLFVSNVSHELRTPLANLKLYLSLLQHGRPERRANYLSVMEREVARLERLIVDLLDLSRLQSEQRQSRPQIREPIDLHHLIETVIQDNSALAESKQQRLLYENPDSALPGLLGNRDQVVRMLTNLVANAINYTPEGGLIVVRSRIQAYEQDDPKWVMIEVTDTGIGIPTDELSKIFERFYRGSNVNPNIPGTGLGLAIIKEIIDLHDGQIEVESQPNQGSTFRLLLPPHNTSES